MIIHELILKDVGTIRHLRMHDLPETGVLVISGDNEQGKSTIMKALSMLLYDKHTSKTAEIKALQRHGADEPIALELEATVGEVRFRIFKQFLRQPKAVLQFISPQARKYTGGDAHDQLQALLNEQVDVALLKALFYQQGPNENGNSVLEVAGIPMVQDVLEVQRQRSTSDGAGRDGADLDNVDSPDEGAVFGEVAAEYAKYWTKRGDANRVLKDVQAAVRAAEEEFNKAQANTREMDELVSRLEDVEADLAENLDTFEARKHEAKGAEAALVEAEQGAREQQVLQLAHTNAVGAQELARQNLNNRVALKQRLEQIQKEVAAAEEQFEQERRREEERKQALAEKEKQLEAAQDELSAAPASDIQPCLQAIHFLKKAAPRLEDLQSAVVAGRALAAARAAKPPVVLSQEAQEEIERARRDYEDARQRLDAQAPSLTITSVDGAERTVELSSSGEPEHLLVGAEPTARAVTSEVQVEIAGVRLNFDPGEAAANYQERVEQTQAALQRCYQKHSITDPEEISEIAAHSSRWQNSLREAEQTHNYAVNRLPAKGIEKERGALADELRAVQAGMSEPVNSAPGNAGDDASPASDALAKLHARNERVQTLLVGMKEYLSQVEVAAEIDSESEPYGIDADELIAIEQDLREQSDKLQELRREVENRVVVLQNQFDAAKELSRAEDLERSRTNLETKRSAAEVAERELSTQQEANSDEQLTRAVAEAEAQIAEAEQKLAQYQGFTVEDVTHRREEKEALDAALENLRIRIDKQRQEIARYRGSLDRMQGITEDEAIAGANLERLKREESAVLLRANAAKLLMNLMETALNENRRQLAAPYTAALKKFAGQVFGDDVSFELDDRLKVTARVSGANPVEVERLSAGATEQLAVIQRMAIADLVSENVTVAMFLDDTLSVTDSGRRRKMNRLLKEAAEDRQIFVLTSSPERFDTISGRVELPIAELKADGLNA